MSEEQAAEAQAEVENDIEQTQELDISESAPDGGSEQGSDQPVEQDSVQKKINKVVAQRYAEKRRADELQKQLDEIKSTPVKEPVSKELSLEAYDYDESAYNAALIDKRVQEALSGHEKKIREERQAEEAKATQDAFNARIAEFGKDDFVDKANAVPDLPPGVADALVQADNGPELIYHLGNHLDIADKIANMQPYQAMIELGKISANLGATKTVTPSSAPDPIEPLNSGGAIARERGPKGATFE